MSDDKVLENELVNCLEHILAEIKEHGINRLDETGIKYLKYDITQGEKITVAYDPNLKRDRAILRSFVYNM